MRVSYAYKLVLGIALIYIATIYLSTYTQKIYTRPYQLYPVNNKGSTKQKYFKYPFLIAWSTCLLCVIWSWIIAKVMGQKQNSIVLHSRRKLGFLFTLNMLPNIFGLLYISSSLLVITKTLRYLFVVSFGTYLSQNQNKNKTTMHARKTLIAAIIVLSAFFFIHISHKNRIITDYFKQKFIWIGVGIILVTIFSDGLFVDYQVYCRNKYFPTPNHIFQSSNFYAFLIMFTASFVTGSLFQQLKFVYNYPQVRWDLGYICVLQLFSQQVGLYLIVVNFNQTIYPLITSTRRIIVLIVSNIINSHNLNYTQWICASFIFMAVIMELYLEVKEKENILLLQNEQNSYKDLL